MPSASTAATIVVGTPQKNRPSFGETLNRASRIAAQTATRAQAGTVIAAAASTGQQACTTTGAAMPNEHMSASESICAPNGLATRSRRASAPSRPSKTTQAIRQNAASRTSAVWVDRKIAVMPSTRLSSVHAVDDREPDAPADACARRAATGC